MNNAIALCEEWKYELVIRVNAHIFSQCPLSVKRYAAIIERRFFKLKL